MLRFNDIADRVLEYNPSCDLALLQRAYVFTAKVHEGQERLSGEPMSAEDITQAMELFGQVHHGDSKEHEGTGLGLPLTNRLVEAQGGYLLIESEPNIGTTVKVKFPKDKVAQSK